jgi:hypothetical protein
MRHKPSVCAGFGAMAACAPQIDAGLAEPQLPPYSFMRTRPHAGREWRVVRVITFFNGFGCSQLGMDSSVGADQLC